MGDSLLIGAAKMGMDIRLLGPKDTWPEQDVMDYARGIAEHSGARITLTDDIGEGVTGVDFIYTDVWLSMGDPESEWKRRIDLMRPYQVDGAMMERTGNPATKFLHCLPAFHNAETEVGANIKDQFGLDAMEVTEEVFESEASVVFDQAENRMHTIKAVLVATIGT
jgi:ornithine carbamoyltransferase